MVAKVCSSPSGVMVKGSPGRGSTGRRGAGSQAGITRHSRMGSQTPARAGTGAADARPSPQCVPVRPALFTSTSSRFSSRSTAWAKARTVARELVSSSRSSTAGLPVAARISSTAAWPRSRLRHARMVRAFLRARSRATHLPIPAAHRAGTGWSPRRGVPGGLCPHPQGPGSPGSRGIPSWAVQPLPGAQRRTQGAPVPERRVSAAG